MQAFILLCLLVIHSKLSCCLNIVEDFRVISIPKTSSSSSSPSKKSNSDKFIGDIDIASTTTTHTASLLSTVSNSSPTISLSDTVQMVYTDNTNAFYYFKMSLEDNTTEYKQTFPFLLDTGSSLCWVYNASCLENGCEDSSLTKFTDSKLLTISSNFGLSYSGEEVSGDLIDLKQNDITISVNDLSIDEFTMGITSDSPSTFDNLNISGLVGISVSTDNKKNWIYQLYDQDIIDSPLFGLCLLNASHINYVNINYDNINLSSNYGGLLVLGSDAQNFTDDIFYSEIIENDDSYWLLNITNIQVNDGNTTSDFNDTINYREAIIDTGTTGIALPLNDAENLMSKVFGSDLITDGDGNFAFPCTSTNHEIILTIGKNNFTVRSEYFMGAEYTSSSLKGYCASKLQGFDSPHWVLGATFIQNYFTIFDLENNRIGLSEYSFDMFKLVEQSSSTSTKGSTTQTSISKKQFTSTRKATPQNTSQPLSNNSSSQTTTNSKNLGSHLYPRNFFSIKSVLTYISICLITVF